MGNNNDVSIPHPMLILTVGAPGSGKSTWVTQEKSKIYGSRSISRDDIRESLYGKEYHDSTPVRECEKQVSLILLATVEEWLSHGHTVFVDNTHTSFSSMKDIIRIARSNNVPIRIVWVHTPMNVCIERNKKRCAQGGRYVPEEIISSMWNKIEKKWSHFNPPHDITFDIITNY